MALKAPTLFASDDPIERLAQIWARYQRTGAAFGWADGCYCADNEHCNALHDLVADDVPWLLARLTELWCGSCQPQPGGLLDTRPCTAPDCGNPDHSELEHWGGVR